MSYELNPVMLVFKDVHTETLYRKDQFERIIGPIRVILLSAGLLFFLAWIFNSYIRASQPDITQQVLNELRLFNNILLYGILPLCFILFAFSYISFAQDLYQFSAGLMAILVVLSSVGMVLSSAYLTAQHYSFGFLIINTWVIYTISQLRFIYATAICWSGSILYVVLLFDRFPNPLFESATYLFLLTVTNFLGPVASFQIDRTSRLEYVNRCKVEEREKELEKEKDKSERLLLNILPEAIALRLKSKDEHIADRFDHVSVLFADIVGFTDKSASMPADELVGFLNTIFSQFDSYAQKYQLEKIKTIGDAYMVAAGVPEYSEDHACRIAHFALELREQSRHMQWPDGSALHLRIGIHSGPAVAGVIGKQKFIYDLWGDTVNTASRMESQGLADEIQVSDFSYHLLVNDFKLKERGLIDIKGKGMMKTWILDAVKSETT